MAIEDISVCNTDILQSAKFLFSIPRLTTTQFFCQRANIPGISTQNTLQATPFVDLPIPGDKIFYEDLSIEFLLDEELKSWISIHNWMTGIAFPKEFDQYKNLAEQSRYSKNVKYPQYADAELITLSSNNVRKVKIHFVDMFPVQLSGFDMDVRIGSEKTMTATASFKYKRYEILPI